jgi:hypothetical protein
LSGAIQAPRPINSPTRRPEFPWDSCRSREDGMIIIVSVDPLERTTTSRLVSSFLRYLNAGILDSAHKPSYFSSQRYATVEINAQELFVTNHNMLGSRTLVIHCCFTRILVALGWATRKCQGGVFVLLSHPDQLIISRSEGKGQGKHIYFVNHRGHTQRSTAEDRQTHEDLKDSMPRKVWSSVLRTPYKHRNLSRWSKRCLGMLCWWVGVGLEFVLPICHDTCAFHNCLGYHKSARCLDPYTCKPHTHTHIFVPQ